MKIVQPSTPPSILLHYFQRRAEFLVESCLLDVFACALRDHQIQRQRGGKHQDTDRHADHQADQGHTRLAGGMGV